MIYKSCVEFALGGFRIGFPGGEFPQERVKLFTALEPDGNFVHLCFNGGFIGAALVAQKGNLLEAHDILGFAECQHLFVTFRRGICILQLFAQRLIGGIIVIKPKGLPVVCKRRAQSGFRARVFDLLRDSIVKRFDFFACQRKAETLGF